MLCRHTEITQRLDCAYSVHRMTVAVTLCVHLEEETPWSVVVDYDSELNRIDIKASQTSDHWEKSVEASEIRCRWIVDEIRWSLRWGSRDEGYFPQFFRCTGSRMTDGPDGISTHLDSITQVAVDVLSGELDNDGERIRVTYETPLLRRGVRN